MSDTVWLALIAMVGSTAALWMRMKSIERAAQKAADDAKVDAAKKDQALREIHILVDGNLQEALRRIQKLTQVIADAHPEDEVKALAAETAANVVGRKDAAIDSLIASGGTHPAEPLDKPKGS